MKVNYFGYSMRRVEDDLHFRVDLKPIFRAFTSFNDINYKNSFNHKGESVFLLPAGTDFYLFLATRSHEVIKKIQSNTLTVSEIYASLTRGEKLEFASYVLVQQSMFAFASTVMAPRVGTFTEFVCDIFRSQGLNLYQFIVNPLLAQGDRADALQLPFIGRSVIQIDKNNTFAEQLRGFVGGTEEDFRDVDSFEIVIRPRRKQNIAMAVKHFVRRIPDAGLNKVVLKMRDELHDHLTDFYMAGLGQVSDQIEGGSEAEVRAGMLSKMEVNGLLREKVAEHEANQRFQRHRPARISELSDIGSWTANLPSVQAGR